MWHWINGNAQAISAIASLCTLAVWMFYAHLLYAGFRRQRRARIMINQGWGQALDSVCLICNMSQEPIYLQCLMMTLRTDDGEYSAPITDIDHARPSDSNNRPGEVTRQGPLNTGQQMNLGTFRSLIRQTARRSGLADDGEAPTRTLKVKNFKISVICTYGPEGGTIGAQRKFLVRGEQRDQMRPAAVDTKRLTDRLAQRKMRRWLEQQI